MTRLMLHLRDEVSSALPTYAIDLLFDQPGEARQDLPGHEHFGFDDGVSQPGIVGITDPQNPADPKQGQPGQDLLQPGEFVIGYERMLGPPPAPAPVPPPEPPPYASQPASPVPAPGTTPPPPGLFADQSPAWTLNGSYLVFRRLRQDVGAFHRFVSEQAQVNSVTEDFMGAKLVGRYASGAPLEPLKDNLIPGAGDPNLGDPSVDHPEILDFLHINNFEYGGDVDGAHVPRASHIRKAYPRDQVPPGEEETQTHRLLRRGIAYGAPFDPDSPTDSATGADADRGLLFLCFQTSIARQFEFVQQKWVNPPDFPQAGDGNDPVIGLNSGPQAISFPLKDQTAHINFMQRWVVTTGGDYFFQPSISALGTISRQGGS